MVRFFFFKQKTAYEMLRSLVGSEMCIRDRWRSGALPPQAAFYTDHVAPITKDGRRKAVVIISCLLYTSDAADDLLCVDLGGRRIIKKKKNEKNNHNNTNTDPIHNSY